MITTNKIEADTNELQTMTKQFAGLMLLSIQEERDIERAIMIAEWLARFLAMNSCGIYRLDALEEGISRRLPKPPTLANAEQKLELHIASEVYRYGGHTRLIQTLLNSSVCGGDVLLTRRGGIPAVSILNISNGELIFLEATTGVGQACEIMEVASRYKHVFIHIHPDDIVASSALRNMSEMSNHPKFIFVNHADHTFSLGLGSADVVFELSSYGWGLRGKRGTESISSFIGIPIEASDTACDSVEEYGLVLSAADPYKFKPQDGLSLPKIIRHILKSNENLRMVIVGPRYWNFWWWPLIVRFPSRVKIKARVPYVSYLKYLKSCAVYLDSYPVTGGTAFTEALLKGCNVAGIVGPISGYGLADELKSKDVTALNEFIARIVESDSEVIKQQRIVRARADIFHSPMAVRQRITKTIEAGILLQPPLREVDFPNEPWFDCVWKKKGNFLVSGFRCATQARAAFPIIAICLLKSFGVIRAPMTQLLSKTIYAVIRKST